jgi:lipid-A-disaccharide synthase-like uncharacterized protein
MTTLSEMPYIYWAVIIIIGMLLMMYAIFFQRNMAFEQRILGAALLVPCIAMTIALIFAHYNLYPEYQSFL